METNEEEEIPVEEEFQPGKQHEEVHTLPPGVVTEFIDLRPIEASTHKAVLLTTELPSPAEGNNLEPSHSMLSREENKADAEMMQKSTTASGSEPPELAITVLEEERVTTTKGRPSLTAEMIMPISAMVAESKEEEEGIETTSSRPPPTVEMIIPVKAMVAESTEKNEQDEERLKAMTAEMVVPVKAVVEESKEDEGDLENTTAHTPPTAEMIMPEKALIAESGEEKMMVTAVAESEEETTAHPQPTPEMVEPTKATEAETAEVEEIPTTVTTIPPEVSTIEEIAITETTTSKIPSTTVTIPIKEGILL